MKFMESDKVELKKSLSQLDEALKAVCSFLNHRGGKVYFGIAYKRTGTENRIIPPDELKKIIVEQNKTRWDEEICKDAKLQDIDEISVRDFLRKANEERRYAFEVKVNLRLTLEKMGLMKNKKPTNTAVIFFGKNPQKFFSQAEVRCARFKGNNVISPFIDMRVIKGRILDQVEEAEEFVLSHIKKAAWIKPGKTARI